jgi:Ca2+-binding RTX toxin-like protein
MQQNQETARLEVGGSQYGPLSATLEPGVNPATGNIVVNSVSLGEPIPRGGERDAPAVTVSLDLSNTALPQISAVRVTLLSPTGRIASATADADDGENLESILVKLDEYDPSGEWAISSVRISFKEALHDDIVLEEDDLSSLMESRFIDFHVPSEDITPPEFSDLDLPSRSFTVASGNPFSTNDDDSVAINFDLTVADPASGLNIIDFEFDIGPGSPAVVGGEVGLFGDIPGGALQLATLNTAAPAGNYVLTRLRLSDDQGNSHLLTTDDIEQLGYETVVNVADRRALEDSSAPVVTSFEIAHTVNVGASGGTLTLTFTGSDDNAVESASLRLRGATGSLHQLNADVVLNTAGTGGTATFEFSNIFQGGDFTIESLTLNDAAFNRATLTLDDTSLVVNNAFGGDSAANRIQGNAGDNTILARDGNDVVVGGDGDDLIDLGSGNDTAWAGSTDSGSDTIVGGSGDDTIAGGAGNDLIIGGHETPDDVRDLLFVAYEERLDGTDVLYGGAGDDTLYGGSPVLDSASDGTDEINDYGSAAANILYAGSGNDHAYGARGDDTIGGGDGNDTIFGREGHDVIFGGKETSVGGSLNDQIHAGDGNDSVYASAGNDLVTGGADSDLIYGGSGADTLAGDGGHDTLYGGTGNDILSGGSGNDSFYFAAGSGADTVSDFGLGDDLLILSGYSSRFSTAAQILQTAHIVNQAGATGLLLDLGEGDSIFLVGVTTLNQVHIEL